MRAPRSLPAAEQPSASGSPRAPVQEQGCVGRRQRRGRSRLLRSLALGVVRGHVALCFIILIIK